MKLLTILGARPQFVKAATVSRALKSHQDNIKEVIVHTGQHFDANMSDVFFEEMHIPKPDYHLGVSGLSHAAMTGRMLEQLEEAMLKEKPDWVLVYGDTNSTLAGALAASKLHIPIAHVEAGLRSFNMQMPEEINRILTDRISKLLFCPTDTAVSNLKREGFDNYDCSILKTGDVMQDAALFHATHAKPPKDLSRSVSANGFMLATVHRAESTDNINVLKEIVEAINTLHHEQMPIVLPLHPRTRKKLDEAGLKLHCHILEPISYLEMVYLLQQTALVMTDSGGLQKEAYFFSKPCVTLRTETEWVELIEHNVNALAPLKVEGILATVENMKNCKVDSSSTLYGGGTAAERIVETLFAV